MSPTAWLEEGAERAREAAGRASERLEEGLGRLAGRLRILDRYVLSQFLRIFLMCVLGVPFLFIAIDLTDRLDNYLGTGATGLEVFLHYIYQFPYQALLAFPIAALLAAVFTVASMTRHFETTAAKAGGVSFYRLTAPVLIASFGISLVALALTEVVPTLNRRAEDVLGERETRSDAIRSSFVFRGEEGRIYKIGRLDTRQGQIDDLQIEREGTGSSYPTYTASSTTARWEPTDEIWRLESGHIRFFPDASTTRSFEFRMLWQKAFRDTPQQLLADPKDPDEMGYAELGRFIEAIQRSGGTARELIVERALKISFPFTCFIIVLFGTPLAHSTRRGGAPISVGIALATTIVFLILIRVSQALGAGGAVPPTLAAWIPNAIFLTAGLWLTTRVRT